MHRVGCGAGHEGCCTAAQVRASINAVTWTPEGRRCLTSTQAGEFTLWHGQHFGFETILQVALACTWARVLH